MKQLPMDQNVVSVYTCTEQIMNIRNTLRYLGTPCPLHENCFIFGDNKSVVNSASVPHAKLHKRHIAISFCRVREAIAGGVVSFRFLAGKNNPTDIMPKHWGYQQVWQILEPILFWKGNNMDLIPTQDDTRNADGKDNIICYLNINGE